MEVTREIEPTTAPRQSARAELQEIKRVQIAILHAIAAIEDEIGEEFMPDGSFHGIKFG